MAKDNNKLADADAKLLLHLAELETCLGTPLVPGELVTWFDTVATALADLQPILRRQTTERHRLQFDQIMREDPALQRSVEHLRADDEALMDLLQSLQSQAVGFAAKAAAIEPDEALMGQEWTRFVDEGLWFVIRVRKQDTAIHTWLGEALNRERGTGD